MRHYVLAALMTAVILTPTSALADPPVVGNGEVFASLPDGASFPEGVIVDWHKKYLYVTRPAASDMAGQPASTFLVYDLQTAELLEEVAVEGELLEYEHANVEGALGSEGELYINNTQLGVLKFTRNDCGGWTQELYSDGGLPIVYPDAPSIPNGMAFGPDGELYVADSMQGALWEVPVGGGTPELLFADIYTLGVYTGFIGLNGIKLDPDREYVYITNTTVGDLYRLPLGASSEAELELVYAYGPGAMPDGLAFDKDGDLYVVMAGENRISVLSDLNGTPYESASIGTPAGADVAFSQPSTIALDPHGRYGYVVNHALFAGGADPSLFAVFKIYFGVRGDALP